MLNICIPKNKIKRSKGMQKKISIEEILEEVKFVDESEVNDVLDDYVPISVAVSIRSTHGNKVVVHKYSSIERYYSVLHKVAIEVHFRGIDLLAYLASLVTIMSYNPEKEGVNDLLMSSYFLPVGLYYPDDTLPIAYFYCQVIIDSSKEEEMQKYLNEGYELKDIDDDMSDKKGNLKVFTNELLKIKKEENHEEFSS